MAEAEIQLVPTSVSFGGNRPPESEFSEADNDGDLNCSLLSDYNWCLNHEVIIDYLLVV